MCRRLTVCILFILTALSAGAAERQTLRWLGHWKGEGLREKLVLETMEDFQFLHQDIDVQLTFSSDILPHKSQNSQAILLAEMIRSGEVLWDVIWLDQIIYTIVSEQLNDPLWGEKHLVDFSEIPTVRDAHRPELLNDPDFCKPTGGILTGPYIEGFLYCLWYNTALAKKIGLEIPAEEMTFNDLLECLRAVNEYNAVADESIAAFPAFKRLGTFSRLAQNLFESALPDQPSTAGIRSAQKQTLEALEQIAKLCPGNTPETTWPETARLLDEDKILFLADATWRYNTLLQHSESLTHKMRPVQMPGFRKQTFYCGGFSPVWAVMKHSPARQTAIQLMEFWCAPETIEKWTRYTKSPSGIAGSLYDPEYGNDPVAIYQRKLQQGRKLVPGLFQAPESCQTVRQLIPLILPIMDRKLTARQAMETLKMQTP